MQLQIEIEREDDGRFLAAIPVLPGVMAYGPTRDEAITRVKVLALRVIADEIEHGEGSPAKRPVRRSRLRRERLAGNQGHARVSRA